MTSIEFQNEHGIYKIELPSRNEMTVVDVFELLIVPVLQAAGYSKECIDDQLAGES